MTRAALNPDETLAALTRLEEQYDALLGIAALVTEWRAARAAFLALPPNSPDARAALERLASAEDALYRNQRT